MLLRSVWILLSGFTAAAAAVFVQKHEANNVLQRWRRANSGFLEELKQGNLERECIEEICDYEEAREVFEDDTQTKKFWREYTHQRSCFIDPCRNGRCVYVRRRHVCHCTEGYKGEYCETPIEEILKCRYQNGHCQHFCDGSGERPKCFCADGYKLGEDRRQCVAQVEYPCGRLPPQETGLNQTVVDQTRLVGSNHCPKGDCPWQVLVKLNGNSHCGGALISPTWVVTAAHCIHGNNSQNLTVVAGEHNLDVEEGTEQIIPVSMAIAHEGYVPATGERDVALLQLSRPVTLNRHAVPICLPTRDFAQQTLLLIEEHTVSGWGKRTSEGNADISEAMPTDPVLHRMSILIEHYFQCYWEDSFNNTDNVLCITYQDDNQEECRGNNGSPLVTLYGSTHFLTGVVGGGRGCSHLNYYYEVYANMANFVDWVEGTMKDPPTMMTMEEALEMLEQRLV